jgi:hypothetical protein
MPQTRQIARRPTGSNQPRRQLNTARARKSAPTSGGVLNWRYGPRPKPKYYTGRRKKRNSKPAKKTMPNLFEETAADAGPVEPIDEQPGTETVAGRRRASGSNR